ncbi:MAG: hypothetical protein RL719_1087 [Actinomycetota bacterium]
MVSTKSWPDVVLAILFVLLAVVIFVGTFYFGGAYVFSTVKERWHDYTPKKRIQVISRILISALVITVLIVLSAQRLH